MSMDPGTKYEVRAEEVARINRVGRPKMAYRVYEIRPGREPRLMSHWWSRACANRDRKNLESKLARELASALEIR